MKYAAYKCDLRRMQPYIWETAYESREKRHFFWKTVYDPTVWLFTDVYFTINCYLNSKNSLEQNIDNWGTIKHSTQSSDEGRDFMKQQSKAVHVSMRQNNVT